MKTGDKVIVPAEINGYGRDLRAIVTEIVTCLTDRGSSSTMRTNPGNKMTKRTLTKEQHFFLFS